MTFSRKGKEKKGWKANQIDYDYVFSLSDRLCSYCLTDQQASALLSMCEYLGWPTRWVKAEGEIDKDLIAAFADGLERNLMSGCCDDNLPIQYRYSPEGVLQRSLNAGGNWTDAPEYDPRVYSPQFPSMPGADGDDKKCIAATGAAALIKEEIGDQLTDDMSRYTLKQLIEDWVGTMIESSNPFQALVTVIANQIFALVIATLRAALTDPVYDTLKCIFYCAIGDNATVNNAQWAEVRSQITSQIGGVAGIFLEHLIYLLGTTGTSNLLRAGGAATGDCSECCPDPCDIAAWELWSLFSNIGTIVSRTDEYIELSSQSSSDFGSQAVGIVNPDGCCYVDHIENVTPTAGGNAYYSDCDHDPSTGGNHNNPFGIECNVGINGLVIYGGTTPFTIKIFLVADSCE